MAPNVEGVFVEAARNDPTRPELRSFTPERLIVILAIGVLDVAD
jgi:hypothetical protein